MPKKRESEEWISQCVEVLKFNIDGSARDKPGPAGIGGVLRDHKGKVCYSFSFFIGIQDSNTAELMAIEKACILIVTNPSLKGLTIDIVSDSKTAVLWINSEGHGSFKHVNTVYDIHEFIRNHSAITITFSSRASNSFADNLAKRGSKKDGDFLHWVID
ncbi:hypothetical protein Dsin_015772 [Dipteronia sinensis]|uniref:RNase H type-1 domain-containing protein n=1 Tax=Dipteronia sinensis TaxID=43782 RepID=A0AAE0ACF3_9ROSI|nr:hypothetical protein Dsin_015772 [Dipteronia sinensis]